MNNNSRGNITKLHQDLKRLVKEIEDLINTQICNLRRIKSYVLNEQQFKLVKTRTEMNPLEVKEYKLDQEENRIFLLIGMDLQSAIKDSNLTEVVLDVLKTWEKSLEDSKRLEIKIEDLDLDNETMILDDNDVLIGNLRSAQENHATIERQRDDSFKNLLQTFEAIGMLMDEEKMEYALLGMEMRDYLHHENETIRTAMKEVWKYWESQVKPYLQLPLLPNHKLRSRASVSGAVFNVSTSIIGAEIMSIPATLKVLRVIPVFVCVDCDHYLLAGISVEILMRFTHADNSTTYAGVMREFFGRVGSVAVHRDRSLNSFKLTAQLPRL
ncbi:hypothetical protein Pint_06668 [Pistacia integerrima]|uniref:Uncharacterized protein n=1 Tax=Pistacia integerrima TaxID=434235 RepID=A0ACC0Z7H8_9ROSI|nr:hypothetical protein Pint_06668 [Pistacia integerrima]